MELDDIAALFERGVERFVARPDTLAQTVDVVRRPPGDPAGNARGGLQVIHGADADSQEMLVSAAFRDMVRELERVQLQIVGVNQRLDQIGDEMRQRFRGLKMG